MKKHKSRAFIGRKAYVRTIEVLVALFITILFVAIIIPRSYPEEIRTESLEIMGTLQEDTAFRNCVMGNETSCIQTRIRQHLPGKYNYTYTISSDPLAAAGELPVKRVFAESAYFSANDSYYSPKIFRIYYWVR